MGAYLVVLDGAGRSLSQDQQQRLDVYLAGRGWRGLAADAAIWGTGRAAPKVAGSASDGWTIGERFAPLRGLPTSPTTPWGAYVEVRPTQGEAGVRIRRAPAGALEAFIWRRDDHLFVASSLSPPALSPLLPRVSIAERQVAHVLVDPSEVSGDLALDGIEAVAPGAEWTLDGRRQFWTPGGVSALGEVDVEAAKAALRTAVDGVVGAWASSTSPLAAEISGGLDSAIAAATLASAAPVRAWLSFHGSRSEGDERDFARSVAQHLGVPLTEMAKSVGPLNAEAMAEMNGAARPALNAVDVDYDRRTARRLDAQGVVGLVTGQGGDSVFLNLRHKTLATGAVAKAGLRAAGDPEVQGLARWMRTSVWDLIATSRRALRQPDDWPSWSPLAGVHRELEDLRAEGPLHPWLGGLTGLPPAKRLQVAGVVQSLSTFNESRRSRVARLIPVPLQQPVLELCLGLSTDRLAFGGRDRALARDAFADRLPADIVGRRSKGDLTALFGLGLAEALPFVRERLLEGSLRRRGLIDASRLEPLLTVESLAWRGGYGDFLTLLAIETWMQDWEGRTAAGWPFA